MTVSKLEAPFYYSGLSDNRARPKLIYRTSKDVFVPPTDPGLSSCHDARARVQARPAGQEGYVGNRWFQCKKRCDAKTLRPSILYVSVGWRKTEPPLGVVESWCRTRAVNRAKSVQNHRLNSKKKIETNLPHIYEIQLAL